MVLKAQESQLQRARSILSWEMSQIRGWFSFVWLCGLLSGQKNQYFGICGMLTRLSNPSRDLGAEALFWFYDYFIYKDGTSSSLDELNIIHSDCKKNLSNSRRQSGFVQQPLTVRKNLQKIVKFSLPTLSLTSQSQDSHPCTPSTTFSEPALSVNLLIARL